MKTTTALLAALAAAALVATAAGASGHRAGSASLVIRHQVVGCHAWSLNGSPFRATQRVSIAAGGHVLVTDDDVMPHLLVQTSGPAKASLVRLPGAMMMDHGTPLTGPGLMAHMGAQVRASFPKAGVYTFTTKAGEDYMQGIVTKGEDNVLKLTVKVV